jgi:hypothetical protein
MDRQPPTAKRRAALRAMTALQAREAEERATLQEIQKTLKQLTKMVNETYVNRVKTSDKQQKAVLDFIKG